MSQKARLLLPFLIAPALFAVAHATPPPPLGLSPAGQEWVNAYEALDRKEVGFCVYMHRKYPPAPGISGTFLTGPCTHFLPPLNTSGVPHLVLRGPLPSFVALPETDQTTLRPWISSVVEEPVADSDYPGFDINANPQYLSLEKRLAGDNQQETDRNAKVEAQNQRIMAVEGARERDAAPRHVGFPTIRLLVLLALVGGIYYGSQKRKGKDAPALPLLVRIGLSVIAVLLGLNVLSAALLSSQALGGGILAVAGVLLFFSPFILLFLVASRNIATKKAITVARKNGYTARKWDNPYSDHPWDHMIATQAPDIMKDFADAPFIKERSTMPRFRLLWNVNHHNRRQPETGWVWAETLDGNPSVGNPPPEEMRTFLQWPTKVKGKHRLTLWEITPETADNLNNGPLRMDNIPVREYPSGRVLELEHYVGNIEGKVVKRPVPPPTDAHGTAQPEGLGNMDRAPDPHGSAQAGGLGDMHLRS